MNTGKERRLEQARARYVQNIGPDSLRAMCITPHSTPVRSVGRKVPDSVKAAAAEMPAVIDAAGCRLLPLRYIPSRKNGRDLFCG